MEVVIVQAEQQGEVAAEVVEDQAALALAQQVKDLQVMLAEQLTPVVEVVEVQELLVESQQEHTVAAVAEHLVATAALDYHTE